MKPTRRSVLRLAVAAILGGATKIDAATTPKVVRIAYAASPFNVPAIVMRANGYLTEAFTPKGIAVESPVITSGAAQFQAIAAGAIDIAGTMGDTSAIIGRANGVDLKVVAAFARAPKAYGIMTRADGPASIQALKGKSVAGPKGTTLNQLLAAALASRNLRLDDVNYLNMDLGAARAALLSGRVDAATLAGAEALAATAAGGRTLVTADGLISPMSVVAVKESFLSEQPELVADYLKAQARALDFMRSEPERALEIAAGEQKIPLAEARTMYAWYDFSPTITESDIHNMEACQKFLLQAGMLQTAIDVRRDLLAA
jgi:sulfonate transport system substrate-binding protein